MPTRIIHATLEHDEHGNTVVVTDGGRFDQPTMDWARPEAMSDAEVLANAESDPDTVILSDEQQAKLRQARAVRAIRLDLELTQEEFASRFGLSLGTLRDWEQGRRSPDATARTLLRVIAVAPDLVANAAGGVTDETAAKLSSAKPGSATAHHD